MEITNTKRETKLHFEFPLCVRIPDTVRRTETIFFYLNTVLTSQSLAVYYVPPGLILKNTTWCSLCIECFVTISEQTAAFALYVID